MKKFGRLSLLLGLGLFVAGCDNKSAPKPAVNPAAITNPPAKDGLDAEKADKAAVDADKAAVDADKAAGATEKAPE